MQSVEIKIRDKVFAECITIDQDVRFPNEMRDDACYIYLQQGNVKLYSRNERLDLNSNESVLMQCGNYMSVFQGLSPENPIRSVVFHIDRDMIYEAFDTDNLSFLIEASKRSVETGVKKFKASQMMDAFVDSMKPYFDYPDSIDDDLLLVKMKELVLILCKSGQDPISSNILGKSYSPETLQFDKVIENNLYNNLSIKELAFLTHKSESTFKRYFNKHYGMPPARYFRAKRLAKASNLIQKGGMFMNEIAWECGFENAAHFSTVFTDHYGMSPKKFQSELQSNGSEIRS